LRDSPILLLLVIVHDAVPHRTARMTNRVIDTSMDRVHRRHTGASIRSEPELIATYRTVGTPAYHLGFLLCIQFTIPGDRREST
jgi:hypothetical protein